MIRSERRIHSPQRSSWRTRVIGTIAAFGLTIGVPLAAGDPAAAGPSLGSVSGTVNANGSAPAWAMITLYAADQTWPSYQYSVATDTEGFFEFDEVAPGRYKAEARASNDLAPSWWENATSFQSASVLEVKADAAVTGIDFSLVPSSSISGTVKSASGDPVANMWVSASTSEMSGAQGAASDEEGNYSITGLSAGTYTLEFPTWGLSESYVAQWWSGKANRASADPLVLNPGEHLTGKDATMALGATISGNVQGSGSPNVALESVAIYAMSTTDPAVSFYASSDPDGNYTLRGLPSGSYRIQFSTWNSGNYINQWWQNAATQETATPLVVSEGEKITGANVVLDIGASIEGTVTGGPENVPLEGVHVNVQSSSGGLPGAVTDSDGKYRIDKLAPGDYTLRFDTHQTEHNFVSEWWQAAKSWDDATKITVGREEQLTGKDANLAEGSRVSGNVKGAGTPTKNLEGVSVYIQGSADENYAGYSTTSDPQGNYAFVGVPAGTYSIRFSAATAGLNYVTQELTEFSVAAGSTVTGKDAVLQRGGSISGNVKAAGQPGGNLHWASVTAASEGDDSYSYANTDEDGNYTIFGLEPGVYHVSFSHWTSERAFAPQWWKNSTTRAAGTPVTVSVDEDAPGRDAILVGGSSITGMITDVSGAPLANIQVPVWQHDGTAWREVAWGFSDSRGSYVINGLAVGEYKVGFTDVSEGEGPIGDYMTGTVYEAQYYNGKSTLTSADSVTVTAAGQQITNETVALKKKPTVPLTLTATPTPTISGKAEVGQVLTASAGEWSPHPVTLTYQWHRDGTAISGATAATYFITADDKDKKITVTVSGSKTGYVTAEKTSSPTVTVAAAPIPGPLRLTATPSPTIVGTARVGHVLSATAGAWEPAPVTIAYQWFRDNTAIPDATQANYAVSAADSGKRITVSATGSKAGFASVTTTSATTVEVTSDPPLTLTATPTPTITGDPRVGNELTAHADVWAPAPVNMAYQWNRQGQAIAGATTATYTPVPADLGKTLDVTVTGTKEGYTTVSKTSVATIGVVDALRSFTAPAPTIKGLPRIGETLTAAIGEWNPTADIVGFQWNRDGRAIEGATGATLDLTAMDVGHRISVTVTGGKGGYHSLTRTSETTAAVVDASPMPPPVVDRFAGDDRLSTAVQISERSFQPGVPVVYVATGFAFPDALAAAPAAAVQGGPLLLTTSDALAPTVADEIKRLKPQKIVVVGGTTAISPTVYNQLKTLAPAIRRDAGEDRLETSRIIVENAFPDGADSVFVATAWNFPDALAASAAAGAANAPVVLVDGSAASVDIKTERLLAGLNVEKAVIAGGETVINTGVETSMRTLLGTANVTRLGGDDRYATAGIINRASFAQSDTVYLANGFGFADALAGAALAGRDHAPLYTVLGDCVPKHVLEDIVTLKATKVVLLGGLAVLSNDVARLVACK